MEDIQSSVIKCVESHPDHVFNRDRADAIHVTPEAAAGGALARVMDGDILTLDCDLGTLHLHVDDAILTARSNAPTPAAKSGWGRELFATFRDNVSDADCGASIFGN